VHAHCSLNAHIHHGMRLQIESGSPSQTNWAACNCLDPTAIVVVWCGCEDQLLLVRVGDASCNTYLEMCCVLCLFMIGPQWVVNRGGRCDRTFCCSMQVGHAHKVAAITTVHKAWSMEHLRGFHGVSYF
jgi:hypothetical protein